METNLNKKTKNLSLGRQSGVHKNKSMSGHYRIIKFCLPEILTLKRMELPNSSSRGLILAAFNQDISAKAFSSNLNLAQNKLSDEQRGIIAKEVDRLFESGLSNILDQLKLKGTAYASTQRKTKAKVEVSPVTPAQAVQARPAPQVQRVQTTPTHEIAKASTAPTASPGGAKEMIRRVIPQFNKVSLSEGFGVKDKDVLTALFSDPAVFAKYQALETTNPKEWITEIVNVIDQARSKQ